MSNSVFAIFVDRSHNYKVITTNGEVKIWVNGEEVEIKYKTTTDTFNHIKMNLLDIVNCINSIDYLLKSSKDNKKNTDSRIPFKKIELGYNKLADGKLSWYIICENKEKFFVEDINKLRENFFEIRKEVVDNLIWKAILFIFTIVFVPIYLIVNGSWFILAIIIIIWSWRKYFRERDEKPGE